jgi:formylglycine-generating enzyme required for sulfatase activity
MPQEESKSVGNSELAILRQTGLTLLPAGDSSALSEIISRSLVHIETIKTLEILRHSLEHEWSVGRVAGDEHEFEITSGVKIVMCWIQQGEFWMGSPEEEEGRHDDEAQHVVRITRGFWLAKTQTTQAQWQAVMGANPSYFKSEDRPVEQVSWDDICGNEHGTAGFLGKLNTRTLTGGLFYLPTEAEWEYACRAGTTGSYAGDLDEMAWHAENSSCQTHSVGQKKPNAWGLYDMHGNVFEWCSDRYGDYELNALTDPRGCARGATRVYRGGGWRDGWRGEQQYCRASSRNNYSPCTSSKLIGFRVARRQQCEISLGEEFLKY